MNRQRVKLLMIENGIDYAKTVRMWLDMSTLNHYEIDSASSLAEARLLLCSKEYDVILLDLWLPNGAGVSTVVEVKKMSKGATVVACTARDSIEIEVEAIQARADGFFFKGDAEGMVALEREILVANARYEVSCLCEKSVRIEAATKVAVGKMSLAMAEYDAIDPPSQANRPSDKLEDTVLEPKPNR